MSTVDDIIRLFTTQGGGAYFGEPVTMLEHALQAAHFAREDGATDELVAAALLHDIGHLLEDVPADIADWQVDARHEEVGGRWLASRFGARIADPVRLHVPAKRFLCATSPSYLDRLSPASVTTLKLQGGPMSEAEVAAFRAEPHFRDGVRLRLFDDRGKLPGLVTAPLEDYRALLARLLVNAGV